jgi:hypothetical protein
MDDTVEPSVTAAVKEPRHDRLGPRSASWLAWALWLLVALVDAVGFALLMGNEALSTRERAAHGLTLTPFLAFATVGAVIMARRPGNRIGWLCWAIGFALSLSLLGGDDIWAVLAANPNRTAAWALLPQLATLVWLGALLGLLPFLVLLFPTGRLPSHRWRPVAWTLGIVVGFYLAARLFTPGRVGAGLPANPLGGESAEGLLRLIQNLAGVVAPVLILAVLVSVVLRFRRARGEERQQLKWFTFVVAAELVLLPGLGGLAEQVAPVLGELVVFPVSLSLIPIAIGVAVLKYRLYDIDRVINRTLSMGCSPSSSVPSTPAWSWPWGSCSVGSALRRQAGPSLAPPWPWPQCSSRPGAASSRGSTGALTGASTTRPRPWKRSAFDSAKRSTWTRCRSSCWRWSTKRCSPLQRPYGSGHRPRLRQVVKGEEIEATPTRDPLHAIYGPAGLGRRITAVDLPISLSAGHRD